MAIAFRSVGTPSKVDVSATGQPVVSVALPAGHVSGDALVMFVLTDGNSNTTSDPAGWTRLSYATNGTSTRVPYAAYMQIKILYRVDTGSLGSSVDLTFSTAAWPAGSPFVLAFVAAYSGCDPAGPVEGYQAIAGAPGTTVLNHPQATTATTGDWLLTYRASSSNSPAATFTCSVGTDVERIDDFEGNEIACALYDSNTALTAGLQTQRVTTASRAATYGSLGYSIVLKPPPPAGSTTAAPAEANVAVTAYSPAVVTQDGPWDLCTAGGLPSYQFAIDWGGDGVFTDPRELGTTYVSDAFGRTVSSGWGAADTGQTWTTGGSAASDFSVGSGTGQHSLGSTGVAEYATVPSAVADVDLETDFSTPVTAAGGSFYAYLAARHADSSNFYCARVQMTATQGVVLSLRKRVGGTETELVAVTTSLTHTASVLYTVRMRLAGSGLWAKVWAAGTTEPDWQVTATDSDLTAAASTGVRSLLGTGVTNTLPVAVSFDNFRVSAPLDADDVTGDVISDISVTYGRDQERQLAPAAVGSAAFALNNTTRKYSPENSGSPLYGDLDPARALRAQVVWNGQTYPLFRGRVDDFDVKADFSERTLNLTFLDGMNALSSDTLSTGVYASMRTGTLINTVLDEAGWTGGRDIDPGATVVEYWWADGTDPLTAIQDLVKSEGPPAIAYVAPDGTFTFRDRHHRMLRQKSLTSQAWFHAGELGECTATGVPQGALSLARPFTYAHGLKDVVNSVTFDVADRAPSADLTQVWQDTTTYTLALGQSLDLTVSSSDPFMNAVTPVAGTDITYTGPGVVGALLSRASGASAKLTLQAIGGTVTISSVQVRAQLLPVQQTYRISMTDAGSITRHGVRTYPNDAPWAGPQDAAAIANMVLLHYASRRPTVQIRFVSSDPAHFAQVLTRTVSDRVRITNDEMRLDDDFFVERVTHTVQRTGATGRPPVHAVVLGCEKDLDAVTNPFAFDVRGSGFDQGVFDPLTADDASQVFVFDDPVQGVFDFGEFGT